VEFELTKEQQSLQLTLREFATAELKPGAAEREKTGEFPREAIKKLCRMGVFGLILPEEYVGKGCHFIDYAIAMEELARHDPSVAISFHSHTLCASHIGVFGTPEQKGRYLAPLVDGEKLGAWALAEPDVGRNPGHLMTSAVADGDEWRLSGKKSYVTNGSKADIIVVLASTARLKGVGGISAFIVPGDAPGLRRREITGKRGFRSSGTVALILNDVRVPRANLLGDENQGMMQVLQMRTTSRVGVAAMAVGIGLESLEESIVNASGRFSAGGSVAEFQTIQWTLDGTMTRMANAVISRREKEVLDWLKEGKSSWDISVILGISERTVYFHVSNIMKKLGASNRSQALSIATRLGLVDTD
jgi:butyryl-CoA dehydrogenase